VTKSHSKYQNAILDDILDSKKPFTTVFFDIQDIKKSIFRRF